MPPTANVTDLLWAGAETIEAAAAALARHSSVELHLPAELHHTVVAHFRDAEPQRGAVELLDVTGGPELLGRFAGIRGFEPIAELGRVAARENARVRLMSPSPVVRIESAGNAEAPGT